MAPTDSFLAVVAVAAVLCALALGFIAGGKLRG